MKVRSSPYIILSVAAPLLAPVWAGAAPFVGTFAPGTVTTGSAAPTTATPDGSGSAPRGTRGANTATEGAATASRGAVVGTGTPDASAGAGTVATNASTSSNASSAYVAGTPLGLSDALSVAKSAGLSVGSAQARIAAAQARLRAAGAFPGTTLTLARAFGSHNTAGFDEDVILSQVIELGKSGSKLRGARADLQAARFDLKSAGNDLEFAIRSAYFDALRSDVELGLARDSLARAQTFRDAAQTQLVAGDVPRQNVVRASIELSRAQSALDAAQSDRRVRLAALRSLLGVPDDAPLSLKDQLVFAPKTYDVAALQDIASRQRADLQSARATLQSKQAAQQVAGALSRPDAFVEARRAGIVNYGGTPNGSSIRVGVVVPLFDFGRNRAGVAEARANVIDSQSTLNVAVRTARLDVAQTYERFVAAQRAVQGFTAGRLAQDKELLDMAQIGYERGATSVLELLDAQSVYRAEQTDYARALATWNTSLADLQRAVGGQLP